jgi:hypothetical protein
MTGSTRQGERGEHDGQALTSAKDTSGSVHGAVRSCGGGEVRRGIGRKPRALFPKLRQGAFRRTLEKLLHHRNWPECLWFSRSTAAAGFHSCGARWRVGGDEQLGKIQRG